MERLIVLGLGSNIGDKASNLKKAIKELSAFFGTKPNVSSVYETSPVGFESDSTFFNQCISFYTNASAALILKEIMAIEKRLGRKRQHTPTNEYASRSIDIDILFIGQEIHNEYNLIVPHPRLHERNFVLIPLSEIAPDFVHPIKQIKVLDILSVSKDHNFVKKNAY